MYMAVMNRKKFFKFLVCVAILMVLLSSCGNPAIQLAIPVQEKPTSIPTLLPTELATIFPVPTMMQGIEDQALGLSEDEIATLSSLEKVADYPLYTMRYYGSYQQVAIAHLGKQLTGTHTSTKPSWGCSLFAALGNGENMLYGRNFDWDYSPALLLYTDPLDGYASASMVDLAYLYDTQAEIQDLSEAPLAARLPLLETPAWPFDGINERGLAVGMAAVPSDGSLQIDPQKETIYSLPMIREMLDHAADVQEAVALMENYNLRFGGPPLHYLLADSTGRSALVEFYHGEMVVTYNEQPWQVATNFLCASEGACNRDRCWRYDTISERLEETQGRLGMHQGMELLAEVSQEGTQWSVLYGLSSGEINVVLGAEFEGVYEFFLE